jgi:pyruvate dehydrogenase E2 component (dihydrolipoamide acetyltransferase)
MPADVIMPALGMAQDTGTVLRWLHAEGDQVAAGEALLEVETDKAVVELESPIDGTLSGVRAGEGEQVPVGEVIAVVLAVGEQPAEPTRPREPSGEPAAAPVPDTASVAASPRRPSPLASPKARRIAAVLAIDLDRIEGSGPGGAIVAADVAGAKPSAPAAAPAAVSGAWRIMAERTTSSWQQVPHFFLHRELDASRLERWRAAVTSAPDAPRISHTDLLVRLVAEALRRHPQVNATFQNGSPRLEPRINVGIAVATDEALVVPVLHGVPDRTLEQIASRRQELVAAARAGRPRPADIEGGTFTISNLGMYGVDSFDAIVNAPQAAILAVGRIADRVVAVDGAAVVRPTMHISLSFDHRVVDGARGAEFMRTLTELIEEPLGLLR